MSTKPRARPGKRRPYHHGDLAKAAVETACAWVAQRGPGAIGLREIARQLDVDHAAIHQHFGSKAAFLIAVGRRCYEDLADALRRADRATRGNGLARLEALAVAFQRFAYRNPGKVSLLSQPHMNSEALDDPELSIAHDRALALLLAAVVDAQNEGLIVAGPPVDIGFAAWIFCLGYFENQRTRRAFDGSVPLAEAGWPRIERHFRSTFRLLLYGLSAGTPSSSSAASSRKPIGASGARSGRL